MNTNAPSTPLAPNLLARVWMVIAEGGETGEPIGPVSADQIARGMRAGKVPSDALVRRTTDVFWTDLVEEPEILAALKAVSAESDVPPPSALPILTAKQFLVWVDGAEPVGPVSADQIARGIRAGKVPSHASMQRVDDIFACDVLDAPEVIEALKAL
jgi:hypothetical protein